jgi:hypothetical protein
MDGTLLRLAALIFAQLMLARLRIYLLGGVAG